MCEFLLIKIWVKISSPTVAAQYWISHYLSALSQPLTLFTSHSDILYCLTCTTLQYVNFNIPEARKGFFIRLRKSRHLWSSRSQD